MRCGASATLTLTLALALLLTPTPTLTLALILTLNLTLTRCECTHLTDFGGVAIPTSMDELLAQLEPTITLPCPDGFFAPYAVQLEP